MITLDYISILCMKCMKKKYVSPAKFEAYTGFDPGLERAGGIGQFNEQSIWTGGGRLNAHNYLFDTMAEGSAFS